MSSTGNNPYHRNKHPGTVTVTLVCGCVVTCRNRPMRSSTVYTCPNNLGHGYNVKWRRWAEGDQRGDNK